MPWHSRNGHRSSFLTIAVAGISLPFSIVHANTSTFDFTPADLELLEQCSGIERQFDSRGLLYNDPALDAHLKTLTLPSLPAEAVARVSWQFKVLREPLINAFSFPDGSIYITTGMLALLENDDQLAFVLAHEIAHVFNRDAYKAFRISRKRHLGVNVLRMASSVVPYGMGMAAYLIASGPEPMSTIVQAGYDTPTENEADRFATDSVRNSGRDPAQALRCIQLMENRLDPESIPEFYTDRTRIKQRLTYLGTMVDAEGKLSGNTHYVPNVQSVIRQNVQMDLTSRRYRTAVARAHRLVIENPGDSGDLSLLAEAYSSLGPRSEALSPEDWTPAPEQLANKRLRQLTAAEEDRALAATEAGRKALTSNLAQADALFRQAIALDPDAPRPHFGLAAVLERKGETTAALSEYRKCVNLAPNGPDGRRAEIRLQALESKLGAQRP